MSYDLAGHLIGEGYPSSRSVATSYASSGRISGLTSNSTTLVSSLSYEAFGGLSSETYGNSLIHAMTYNSRLQPSDIKLGTSGTSDSIFKLNYIYGTVGSPTDANGSILTGENNGNVGRIKYTIGGTLHRDAGQELLVRRAPNSIHQCQAQTFLLHPLTVDRLNSFFIACTEKLKEGVRVFGDIFAQQKSVESSKIGRRINSNVSRINRRRSELWEVADVNASAWRIMPVFHPRTFRRIVMD